MLNRTMTALALTAILFTAAGCSKSGAASSQPKDGAAKLSPEGQATLKAGEAANAVPPDLKAEGVTVSDVTVKAAGGNLEVAGVLKNGSPAAVDGVNLTVTFKDQAGTVVGGHSTQQYFQPALDPGKDQPIVLVAPALAGAQGRATAAEVKVVNLAKPGESPDGWKPLDPKNLPEAKPVPGTAQQITADGHMVKESGAAVSADATQSASGKQ